MSRTLLIVDDEPVVTKSLAGLLIDAGYRVLHLIEALPETKEKNTTGAVLFIDLDRFRKIIDNLGRAIKEQQFLVFYQPQREVASPQISGAEVIMRWLHPQQGIIHPNDYQPLAEETGYSRASQWYCCERG